MSTYGGRFHFSFLPIAAQALLWATKRLAAGRNDCKIEIKIEIEIEIEIGIGIEIKIEIEIGIEIEIEIEIEIRWD